MKTTLILLFTFFYISVLACGGGDELRIYPLGKLKGDIVVLKTVSNRKYVRGTKERPKTIEERYKWNSVFQLVTISKRNKETILLSDTILFKHKFYVDTFNYFINKYLNVMELNSKFRKMSFVESEFSQLDTQCNSLSLIKSNDSIYKIEYVDYLSEIHFPNVYFDNSNYTFFPTSFDWKISSVRKYKLDNKIYIVVNLSTGEFENSSEYKTQYKNRKQIEGKEVYPELIIYHGINFDYLIEI